MRPLVPFLVLSFALGATAAAGDVKMSGRMGVQSGSSGVVPGVGPPPMPHTKPPGVAALERSKLRKRAVTSEREKPHPRRPHKRPIVFFPHVHRSAPETVVIETPPLPPPEPPEAGPSGPPPPDPRGPLLLPARGAATAAPYTVGEPLPQGLPHVALDWRRYDLPEPPPGLTYARIGRDVLLIDATTRVVERRLDPGELEPTEG